MPIVVRAMTYLVAALVVVACAGGSPSAPSSSPAAAASLETTPSPAASAVATAKPASLAPSVAPSASAGPTSFTSTTFGYTLTVPAGWTATQASAPWDGKSAPSFSAPENDKFVGPATASAAGIAAPTTQDLAGYAKERIAANARDHGDTCPALPEINDPIEIGGEPGTLLGWDCGILINVAVAVHKGVGYQFGMRDPAIHAATYPADRATFLALLKSVHFPD